MIYAQLILLIYAYIYMNFYNKIRYYNEMYTYINFIKDKDDSNLDFWRVRDSSLQSD